MKLNKIQEVMANHHEGPACFFATAGSGKTTGIVENLVRKLSNGVDPRRILVNTFNKDAALTLKRRLCATVGALGNSVSIKTSHATGHQILRAYRGDLGKDLLPDYQGKKILKDAMEAYPGFKPQLGDDETMFAAISYLKNHLCWYEEIPGVPELTLNLEAVLERLEGSTGFPAKMIQRCYMQYETAKVDHIKIDFDDMLFQAYWTLKTDPQALRDMHLDYDYLIVDEYQDTNEAQYQIFKLLASHNRNILVVGDDDQSIYAWRGSYPKYMQQFKDEYPDAVSVPLETNYRCQRGVVDAAHALISVNVDRHPKSINAHKDFVRKPIFVTAPSSASEAAFIAECINTTVYPLGEVAVLTRLNAQQVHIENAFIEAKVPYYIVEGNTFFKRPEIQVVLDYLRIAYTKCKDLDAIKRICHKPYRKMRKEQVAGLTCVEDLTECGPGGWALHDGLKDIAWTLEREGLNRTLEMIVHYPINVRAWVMHDNKLSADNGAAQNLEAFREMCKKLTYKELLDKVAKAIVVVDVSDRDKKVAISTIHRAKGLEWEEVYIPGCNQGVLPHNKGNEEEERRLMYVAMTRARELLILTANREKETSQFIDEMYDQLDHDEVHDVEVTHEPTAQEAQP